MASVRQRPNGSWRARYRDEEGKEHAKHFDLKREAQAWLNEVASSQLTGTYVAPAASRGTLEDFYADWSKDQLWTQNTRRLADRAVGECSFRSVPFMRLRRSHGEAYVKQLANRLAPTTVKTRVAYVRIALRAAMLDRRLAYDPLKGVKLPAKRKTEHTMRLPSPAEVRAIRGAIDPAWASFVDVMAYAGLRIGEAAALQVGDIDFLRRTIHVQRQIQNRVGALDVLPPKHGSERVVPIPDELAQRLSGTLRRSASTVTTVVASHRMTCATITRPDSSGAGSTRSQSRVLSGTLRQRSPSMSTRTSGRTLRTALVPLRPP